MRENQTKISQLEPLGESGKTTNTWNAKQEKGIKTTDENIRRKPQEITETTQKAKTPNAGIVMQGHIVFHDTDAEIWEPTDQESARNMRKNAHQNQGPIAIQMARTYKSFQKNDTAAMGHTRKGNAPSRRYGITYQRRMRDKKGDASPTRTWEFCRWIRRRVKKHGRHRACARQNAKNKRQKNKKRQKP